MERKYLPLFAFTSLFIFLFLSHIFLAWLGWHMAFRTVAALAGVVAMSAPLFVHLDSSSSTFSYSSCILFGALMSIGWSWAQTDRVLTSMALYVAIIPIVLGLGIYFLEFQVSKSQEAKI